MSMLFYLFYQNLIWDIPAKVKVYSIKSFFKKKWGGENRKNYSVNVEMRPLRNFRVSYKIKDKTQKQKIFSTKVC